MLNHILYHLC